MTQIRQPRLRIIANGNILSGVISAEINTNNNRTAATWSARIALTADPNGLTGWDARGEAMIELQLCLTQNDWVSLSTGRLDVLDYDSLRGILKIEGRDLAAEFIEAHSRETFANQTASEIAILLANRHGLIPQVTATTTPVGRYYSDGHTRTTLDRFSVATTEWDLLTWLARQEQYDLYVTGSTLVFAPQAPSNPPVMTLQSTGKNGLPPNVTELRLKHSLTLSGAIEVTVRSWNSQLQLACSQTATREGNGGLARTYVYMRPNMTAGNALAYAKNKLDTITAHEYQIVASMPGELTLAPRATVRLVGTDSMFDQNYAIDDLTRRFDPRLGFVQTLRAHGLGI